jgi:hypothetical protein
LQKTIVLFLAPRLQMVRCPERVVNVTTHIEWGLAVKLLRKVRHGFDYQQTPVIGTTEYTPSKRKERRERGAAQQMYCNRFVMFRCSQGILCKELNLLKEGEYL